MIALTEKIRMMVAAAAKEDKKSIEIPFKDIGLLIDAVKMTYYEGVIAGAWDSKTREDAFEFFASQIKKGTVS